MITPNQYKINKKLSREKLLRSGFDQYYDHFFLRKWLYGKIIYADLEIVLEGAYPQLGISVKNRFLRTHYAPFYCEDIRTNNKVYDQIVIEYNRFMDSLCDKKILHRKGYPKPLRKKGKKNA